VTGDLMFLALGFAIGLSGALIPGPLLVYSISLALKRGTAAGVMPVWGHFFVEILVIVLILSGGGVLLQTPVAAKYIPWIGGGALIIMGLLVFRKSFSLTVPTQQRSSGHRYAMVGGVVFTAFNPSFPVWWASVGTPVVLKIYLGGLLGVALFMVGHWAADFGWYALVSYGVSRGKSVLTDRAYRLLIRVLGLILVGFGVFFIVG